MAFKITLFASLFAVAFCYPPHGYQAPQHEEYKEPELPAKYHFAYEVADYHTGDIKSQAETADGHAVKGYYALLQPDHTKRIVEYADEGHGLVAHVKTEGTPLPPPPPPPRKEEYYMPYHGSSYGGGYGAGAGAGYGGEYQAPHYEEHKEPELPAKYHFAYEVADHHTGDIKSQAETADGHAVKGYYALLQPDHTKRIVEYADEGHGFVAQVKTEGSPIPPPPSPPKREEYYVPYHGSSYGAGYGAGVGAGYGGESGSMSDDSD